MKKQNVRSQIQTVLSAMGSRRLSPSRPPERQKWAQRAAILNLHSGNELPLDPSAAMKNRLLKGFLGRASSTQAVFLAGLAGFCCLCASQRISAQPWITSLKMADAGTNRVYSIAAQVADGINYRLQASTNLASGVWSEVGSATASGASLLLNVTNAIAAAPSAQFFRLAQPPAITTDTVVSNELDVTNLIINPGVTLSSPGDLTINVAGYTVLNGQIQVGGSLTFIAQNGMDVGSNALINATNGNVIIVSSADLIPTEQELTNTPATNFSITLSNGPAPSVAKPSAASLAITPADVSGGDLFGNPLNLPPIRARRISVHVLGILNLGDGGGGGGVVYTALDGAPGADDYETDKDARGGNGENGGSVSITADQINVNGPTAFNLGDGGNGGVGSSMATIPGNSATAYGGKGGDTGSFNMEAASLGILWGININAPLIINFGNGGDGGEAYAQGAPGKPDQKGGAGTASGGAGGLGAFPGTAGFFVSGLARVITTCGTGGDGGGGYAFGGTGGPGSGCGKNGGTGGKASATGGKGGDATSSLNGAKISPDGTGGDGGEAFVIGGDGGVGGSCCPNPVKGGNGGAGGAAIAKPGAGGNGVPMGVAGTPGGHGGNGGNGGDGCPAGKGGLAGAGYPPPFVANGAAGVNGNPCCPIGMAIPPTVIGVCAVVNSNEVTITFSEPVDPSTATDPANYLLFGGSGTIPVQGVLRSGSLAVEVVLGRPLMPTTTNNYILVVKGVTDTNGGVMQGATFPIRTVSLQTPCPGGTLLARQTYSICNPDGFWHVVEDDWYQCPGQSAPQSFRVADTQTTQSCSTAQTPPNPIGLLYSTTADVAATCQSGTTLGIVTVCTCDGTSWEGASYNQDQCSDGTLFMDGPIQAVPMTPTPCGGQPPFSPTQQ
jgi:hypothetical protein